MLKFEYQVKNYDKGVELEEKKCNHSVTLEEKKWDHGIKLEEKNWDQSIKLEGERLDWEKDSKEKDRSFEMTNLDQLTSQEHIGKKYDLITQCFRLESSWGAGKIAPFKYLRIQMEYGKEELGENMQRLSKHTQQCH
ncbi:hypothetical protein VP01_59g6 [Puccinia sorghi]|uniref:Uncharacterized protein n=1 Tax=Puccinia sorghi TaxID=27349 RepID=A0A0L6UHF6_9BASI|nr:hypothetical protein VP01_59g6 [Puccinia sorghi]